MLLNVYVKAPIAQAVIDAAHAMVTTPGVSFQLTNDHKARWDPYGTTILEFDRIGLRIEADAQTREGIMAIDAFRHVLITTESASPARAPPDSR